MNRANKALLILILLGLSAWLSCNGVADSAQSEPRRSSQLIMIMLDVSRSMTDTALEEAVGQLEQLYESLPNQDCVIEIYPMHRRTAQFTAPLATVEFEKNRYGGNNEATRVHNERRRKIWLQAINTVRERRRELQRDSAELLDNSCIINSLFEAREFFKGNSYAEKRLIYVSDMLEDCPRTQIDLDRSPRDFEAAHERVSDIVDAGEDLEQVRIEIWVPVTPNYPEWIDNRNLLGFWSKVFGRLGARESEIRFSIIRS